MLSALNSMVKVRKSVKARSGGGGGDKGEKKMELKTLKSRPGAAKRKQVLEGREMERFGKNLANMAEGGREDRWEALRGFIGRTLETKGEFGK